MTKANDILSILEMANLDSVQHGFNVPVKLHLLQPGKKKLPHGPRLKVFKTTIDTGFVIILNKDESKIRLGKGNPLDIINKPQLAKLLKAIKKHRIAFLQFWENESMTVAELEKLLGTRR